MVIKVIRCWFLTDIGNVYLTAILRKAVIAYLYQFILYEKTTRQWLFVFVAKAKWKFFKLTQQTEHITR